jgi:hypothetical protein
VPASKKTAEQVVRVLRDYLSERELNEVLARLKQIPGNNSYVATILRLQAEVARRRRASA